ncbi:MAG: glutaredoxin 3 [Burkholderiaceae bacterium]|jgi:glutaredoxin 3|nr:Glutaredoxin-3 [Betaproteobacteria bacterium MOLA814]|tara:strand:- start:5599 stop:5856 length:258 start_codon:yes stop_codon:yes gene_type:complete
MAKVTMYSTGYCPFCTRAKQLLEQHAVADLTDIRIDEDPSQRPIMMALSGRRTVPQIFIGERHVGGCDELFDLERSGELAGLLQA